MIKFIKDLVSNYRIVSKEIFYSLPNDFFLYDW